MRVVDTNETTLLHACSRRESETRVDLLIESINEQNKSCYTRVVDRNRNSQSATMTWTKQALSNAISLNQKWVCYNDKKTIDLVIELVIR